jgi:glutaminyl-peptide cyclotransferase
MVVVVAAAAALTAGCGSGFSPDVGTSSLPAGRFDAARAWSDLRAQVALGPRPAGSAASRTLAGRLRRELPGGRFEPVPGGLRNVVGTLPGRGRAIVVGAHYDTKDLPGFVGADDGAGGVAVVLELARALRHDGPPCRRAIRFVMFDGEESPRGSSDFMDDGLRGSRADAAAHAGTTAAVIVVDLVADRDLSLPRESSSDPALWARLRRSAARVGAGAAFPDRTGELLLDDHTPWLQRGIPAIDLIDFDYPPFHSVRDDLDAVSPRSLELVGETLVDLLLRMRDETCRRGGPPA